MLLSIAALPLFAGKLWEKNRNKALVSLALGLPVAIWMGHLDPASVAHTAREYVAFIALLGALFVIAGGIVVRGTLAGTPGLNTGLLGVGAVAASLIGTTGASVLLIRPLLRANSVRHKKAHVVVFFIFIVSNCGGLLTPLGDPPLLLGFLKGVPFAWTLHLFKPWLFVNGALLVLFHFLDFHHFHREDVLDAKHDLDKEVERARSPIAIDGWGNVVFLAAVVAALASAGAYDWPDGLAQGAMAALALASLALTPKAVHRANGFDFRPIVEVAVLFLGIFVAMVPALELLNRRGGELALASPRHFFWASGALSSFLDNAPTYLAFTSLAAGVKGVALDGNFLARFLELGGDAPRILAAVSCGAVFMGANTYIGNGPNFMVKAIAEHGGVKMPSFLGYLAWSAAILLPLFAVTSLLFF
jgi:Na+/H+ antiporter NhaD/arsenite permease-like protein